MKHARNTRTLGFALIEALIALLLISIGLIAVSKLQSVTLFGSGDGRARADAANLAQQKLEELRNLLAKGDFTALAPGDAETIEPDPDKAPGRINTYILTWTVTPDPDAKLEQHLVQVSATWKDSRGNDQRVDLNTRVAWDNPGLQASIAVDTSESLISPTGSARRGSGPAPGVVVATHHDGTKVYNDADGKGKAYLTKPDGTIILYLPPLKNGSAQSFARISGRIVFDVSGRSFFKKGGADPDTSDKVFVRLSSEGECIYNNTVLKTDTTDATYKYFDYTCYVGPGWYGNVGVSTVSDGGSDPAVCVGDPSFNVALPKVASPTAGPTATWSATRTYRGFHPNAGGVLLSVGMTSGGNYGRTLDKDGILMTGPFNGLPKPSDLNDFYVTDASTGPTDYLRQDFLVTGSKDECHLAMPTSGSIFLHNAGKHVCISPNQIASPGECPPSWPGAGYADGPGPGGDGTCDIRFEGTAADKPDRVTIAYKLLPDDTSIGACEAGTIKGVGTYFCDIKGMSADKLGTLVVLTKIRDPKGKDPGGVIGTPLDYTLPATCPTEKIVQGI